MRRPLVDQQIPAREVHVYNDATGMLDVIELARLIRRARSAGAHVVCAADAADRELPTVQLLRVRVPLQWEVGPPPVMYPSEHRELDPELRCELPPEECPGRVHYLLANSHTSPGRLYVACPETQRAHRAHASVVRPLTPAGKYWLQGFLVGCVPHYEGAYAGTPDDEADLQAWREAEAQFFETAGWDGRPRVCAACGVLLLPSTCDEYCRACRA